MAKKQIGHLMRVDDKTGEITKSISWYSNKSAESFIMIRKTDGLEWFFKLRNNEKNVLILIHDWADPKTGRVSLQGWQRDYITEKLDMNRRNISLILQRLVKMDCMVRLSQNDFIVNPAHMFKCSTGELLDRIEKYKLLKKQNKI